MMRHVQIPIATVRSLRRAAQEHLQRPESVPSGWSISNVDLDRVLEVFPSLTLKRGYTFNAYLCHNGQGGHGVVYAVPSGTTLADPSDWPEEQIDAAFDDRLNYRPPPPAEALPDVMSAIEGDGSPSSYFEASLLRRELDEFGAFWHALKWTTEEILGSDPFADPGRRKKMVAEGERRERLLRMYPKGYTPDWQWNSEKPTTWAPTVQEAASGEVEVLFFTHSGLEQHRIIRHHDTYCDGSYGHDGEVTVIGRGPIGYMF